MARTRCKNGTRKNKNGICGPYQKKPQRHSSLHRRSSSSRKKKSISRTREEWNGEVDREFNHILAELRDGKLKKMHPPMHPYQPPPQPINAACIKQLTTHELQTELDLRKTQEQHINMLIPRKKIKK